MLNDFDLEVIINQTDIDQEPQNLQKKLESTKFYENLREVSREVKT